MSVGNVKTAIVKSSDDENTTLCRNRLEDNLSAQSRLNEVTVTGIQQEGVRAKVDTRLCHKLTPLGVALKNMNPSDDQQIRLGIGSGFFDSYHFAKPDEYCEYESVMFNKYDDGWRAQSL
jgi:hypothetical protein